jgi:hypothetical protein
MVSSQFMDDGMKGEIQKQIQGQGEKRKGVQTAALG